MNKKIQIVNILITVCICLIINSITYSIIISRISGVNNTNTNTINIDTSKKEKLNINTASKEALQSLHGIGNKLADDIISNRPYSSIYDLVKIDGIGKETVENLKEVITCE